MTDPDFCANIKTVKTDKTIMQKEDKHEAKLQVLQYSVHNYYFYNTFIMLWGRGKSNGIYM